MGPENVEAIKKKALDTYDAGGLHCAEVISKIIIESFGSDPAPTIPRIASGFGGGMGKSIEDTCGTLTGGIIALGYLYGRDRPGGDVDEVMDMVKRFRTRFIDKNGSTTCPLILERFGTQQDMAKCKKMTSEMTGILAELIHSRNEREEVR